MSESENFLKRWSKRKAVERDRSTAEQRPVEDRADNQTSTAPPTKEKAVAPVSGDKTCDLTQLPPLDSIGAGTDITAFLRPGVPAELTHAALRRAWSSDPAIRDFVGLVENGWDFNDPSAMPGFGPISPQEVARLAAKLIDTLPATRSEDAAKQKELSADEQSRLEGAAPMTEAQLDGTSNSSGLGQSEDDDAVQQSQNRKSKQS
jgi:Protein of unknown function (DUF3306)